MTVWVSKGLQYPLVYLPFAFNRNVPIADDLVLFHDATAARCLDIGGTGSAGLQQARRGLGRQEMAGDDIRLTYVALTRAQSQVVAWWAPSWDEPNGGLSRLLRGRGLGEAAVPDRCEPKVDRRRRPGQLPAAGRPPAVPCVERVEAWSSAAEPPAAGAAGRTWAYAASTGRSTSPGAGRPTPA